MLYYYNNNKYPIDEPRGAITKAYSILSLASMGHNDISPSDITYANELLEDVYDNWSPATEENGLYWMLPHLSRILAGSDLNIFLTPEAKISIKNVLYSYVSEKSKIEYASVDASEIWITLGSDNHDMIRKQVFFSASQAFKNNPEWADTVFADGKTATEHYEAWSVYFENYFRERAKKGINIEVGSPVYAGVYLESIFIIRDLAEDDTLKFRAEQFLNLYFADQAQVSLNGVRGGAKSRCQKGASSYNYSQDKGSYYAWMLKGKPNYDNGNVPFDTVPALNSDFRPSNVVLNLYDQDTRGSYEYIASRPGRGFHEIADDGIPHYNVVFPSYIRWYSWCTPKYVLGTLMVDEQEDYTLISTQNRWWGLISSDNPFSRVYFSPITTDNTYNDYAAVQYKGAMLIRRHDKANKSYGFRMYVSSTFTRSTESQWLFGVNSNNSVYFGVYAVSGDLWGMRYTTVDASPAPGVWIEFNNPDTIVVFQSALASDFVSFTAFKDALKARTKGFAGNRYDYNAIDDGTTISLYTDTTLPEINGQTIQINPDYTYSSPYLNSDYDSGVVVISDQEDNTLTLDFSAPYVSPFLETDINKDGRVDLLDIAIFAEQWHQCTNPQLDGCIDAK